ncbi:MAG TPA: radical SAM protein [Candidatus Eisenbacteria bacterium]|nr:radical SAM protein [Candidatus Eisenbacteria bacterium]
MKKLRIAIVDLVARGPTRALYGRLMHANLASIMPQVLAVWCEEMGHDVRLICYTGFEDLASLLPTDIDLLVIGAFSQAAQLSYAVSHLFRQRGVITALGGPHARCYPEDSRKYFDYVLGFTDKETLRTMLSDCRPQRPLGVYLSAGRQPLTLPGVRERWKFIEPILAKAPILKLVPMLGSLGCPYTCAFCIDSSVPYQPLGFDQMKEDLRFLLTKFKRPRVGWHDPNFGVRFDDYLNAIEEAVPPGSIDFLAESSLSLLTEPHLKRLQKNSFQAILPGIESWFDLGNKSKTGKHVGHEKVMQVSEHVNMVLRYIPYVQTNFVLGLDSDEGTEPFALTREFVDRTPGAFPGYSLLSAFGQAAPLNLQYQKSGRVLPFPFHFLNNHHAMNVRPLNYDWPTFYDNVLSVTRHTFSWDAIRRRYRAQQGRIPRWMNVVRAVSSEGFGRIRYYQSVRDRLTSDRAFRSYFEQDSNTLPPFYVERVKKDLGSLWEYLPPGALEHDHHAYLKSSANGNGKPKSVPLAEPEPTATA